MKQKKPIVPIRVTLLTLALTLLFVVSGCGKASEKAPAGSITPIESTAASAAEEESSIEEAENTEAATKEAVAEGKALSLGRLQGGVYTNEYIGLTVELDSSWEFLTAEELQELPENAWELMEGSELAEYIQDIPQIADVQAVSSTDSASFNILYTQVPALERTYYLTLSEEELINELISQSHLLESSYAQAGITIVDFSPKKVTFLGEERTALLMTCDINGASYYILQLHDYTIGEYGVCISFSAFSEDRIMEIIQLFQPLS